MKAKAIFLLWILLVLGLFVRCNKDALEPERECITHERLTNGFGQKIFFTEFPYYSMPYFNPNNSDEIIYRFADGTSVEFDLIKYDLRTKEKRTIYTGSMGRPRWGENGWVLFHVNDSLGHNIYKIRDDGNELTPLTTSGNCFFPEWDLESNKFSYQFAFTTPTKYILAEDDGSFIDTTLCGSYATASWQHSDFFASSGFAGLAVYNPYTCETVFNYETDGVAQSANGAEWLDEKRIIWCHTSGIYLTNIETRQTELIRETCNADTYQLPTYAPDIDKVIFQRMERILDTETSGRAIFSLVMMNPDGTEEETIEIE